MRFRTYICITAICLSVIMMIGIGVPMYINIINDVTEMMTNTDNVQISTASENINSVLENIVTTCAYLKYNSKILENLNILDSENVLMSERVNALFSIQNILNVIINDNSLIKWIVIATPEHTVRVTSSNSTIERLLVIDNSAANEITLRHPADHNYFEGEVVRENPMLSQYAYYSFCMSADESVQFFVVLYDSFLSKLIEESYNTNDSSNILVFTKWNNPICVDAENTNIAELGMEPIRSFVESGEENQILGNFILGRASVITENWTVVCLSQRTKYIREYSFIFGFCIAAIIISVVLSIGMSRMMSKTVLRPIKHVLNLMQRYNMDMGFQQKMKEKRRALTIRENLGFFFLITVFIPFIIFIVLLNFGAAEVVKRQSYDQYQALTENISRSFSSYFDLKEDVATRIIYDNSIIDMLGDFNSETDDMEEISRTVEDNIYYGLSDSGLDIYDDSVNLVYSNNMLSNESIEVDNDSYPMKWTLEKIV